MSKHVPCRPNIPRHFRRVVAASLSWPEGLVFKTSRSIVQLRPKKNRLELMVIVARAVHGDRVRRQIAAGRNQAIFTDLRTADDIDDWVHELVFEAYDLNPG